MMSDKFYNGKFAVIVKDKLATSVLRHVFINDVDIYQGKLTEQAHKVKQYELDNDVFYSGHLIVNNADELKRINPLSSYTLTNRECYFTKVINSGVDSECSVSDDLILTSSWNLPIIANNYRTSNSLYGDLFVHRVRMLQFKPNV
jgi:hypothetical protein